MPTQKINGIAYLRHLSDVWVISCCLLIVYFTKYPGIADAIYGYLYVAAILGYRFLKRSQPLNDMQALMHMAASFSIITAFDKIAGYPNSNNYVILEFFAVAVVLGLSVRFTYRFKSWLPLLALLILFTGVIVIPLELSRNVAARFIYEDIPPIYVTKIDPPHIYGVSLYRSGDVVRFTKSQGTYHPDSYVCCIESLGSGTMDPQGVKIPFQAYQLMRLLYAPKVPGRNPAIDLAKDAELARTLEKNFASFELLRQAMTRDTGESNLDSIYLTRENGLQILCKCNRYKSCTEKCPSAIRHDDYADQLGRLAIDFAKVEKRTGITYFATETNRFPHHLFSRQRGLAYSPNPIEQLKLSDQELIPVRDGWYVFDRRI